MGLKLVSLNARNQKIIIAAVVICSLCLLFFVWVWPTYTFLSYDNPPSIPFDSVKWKNKNLEESGHPIRIQMVDDLIESGRLKNMSKDEVIELLGEPDDFSDDKISILMYWLGPERSPISIDHEFLHIRFDSEQRVSEYEAVQH